MNKSAAVLASHRYNGMYSITPEPPLPTSLLQSDLPGLELIHRGKVRDVYALPGNRLLIVATTAFRPSTWCCRIPSPARARC